MNIENFDNELSSDDSDYCPEKHAESASENSGPDEDDPVDSDEASGAKKLTKRKKVSKRRKTKPVAVEIEEQKLETGKVPDPEEEKRKADAIWADFLSSTDTPFEPKSNESNGRISTSSKPATSTTSKQIIPAKAPVVKEIFEFAGETIEIPSKSTEPEKSANAAPKIAAAGFKRNAGGGLASVLNQLTKKNKLSVLEKTKLDWDGFKSNEGINEELQTHNRGREG